MHDHTDTADGACNACHKRDPEYGLVCEPCRRWLPVALASLLELAGRLQDQLIPADDSTTAAVLVCRTCHLTVPAGHTPRHPGHPEHDHSPSGKWHGGWTARHLIRRTAGPAPSIAPDIIVTGGGHEAPVPLDLHAHDLLGPVIRDGGRPIDVTGDNWIPASRLTPVPVNHTRFEVTERREETEREDGTLAVTFHRDFRHHCEQLTVIDRQARRDPNGYKVMIPAGDQIGAIPVAQILDQEMRAWADAGAPGSQHRPTPTIPSLVDWLGKRLDWACDNYPGIDAFADMLSSTRGALMGALGDFDPQAELCDGVDCPACTLRMLYRRQDGTGDIECQNPDCRRILTPGQYRDHLKEIAPTARRQRQSAVV
ncbi:hypothetical protein [Micromonospora sp. NPDC005174]|uniref:hypothetical protein n=1 Tax=Micromonospora sp. NPDC005174 TaxID=3157018 RepID=UPI0033AB4803